MKQITKTFLEVESPTLRYLKKFTASKMNTLSKLKKEKYLETFTKSQQCEYMKMMNI